MPQVLSALDLNKNELRQAVLHNLGTDPVGPSAGQVWFNTTDHLLKYYSGSTVVPLYPADNLATPTTLVLRDANGDFSARYITASKILVSGAPAADNELTNKAYVDAAVAKLDRKESVRAATTANITLSGLQTIDGVTLLVGNRVLVKNQTDPVENGIYVAASGAWTRAADADSSADVTSGMAAFVSEGTVNGGNGYVLVTSDPIGLGITGLTFTQFSGGGQITLNAPLSKNGNIFSLNYAARLVNSGGSLDLASGVVSAGTYSSVTVDTYGRVTAGGEIASTNGFVVRTGSGAYSARSLTTSDLPAGSGKGYAGTITGDGSTTTFTVTHNLATTDVLVLVLEPSNNYAWVIVDTDRPTSNTARVTFATAPANGKSYRVVAMAVAP